MKVGDLVKDNHPSWLGPGERIGMVISESNDHYAMAMNKAFNILWHDGTIGKNVWNYDLKIVKSS